MAWGLSREGRKLIRVMTKKWHSKTNTSLSTPVENMLTIYTRSVEEVLAFDWKNKQKKKKHNCTHIHANTQVFLKHRQRDRQTDMSLMHIIFLKQGFYSSAWVHGLSILRAQLPLIQGLHSPTVVSPTFLPHTFKLESAHRVKNTFFGFVFSFFSRKVLYFLPSAGGMSKTSALDG